MQAQSQIGAARGWAIFRLVLGMLQMAGAAFSLGMLIGTGVNPVSLAAVVVTALLTTVSVLLFGKGLRFPKALSGGNDGHGQT